MNTSTISFNDFFSEAECLNEGTHPNLVPHSEIWKELQKDFPSDHTWMSSQSEPTKQKRKELNDELRANSNIHTNFSEGISAEYHRLSKDLSELSCTGVDSKIARLVPPLQYMADEMKKVTESTPDVADKTLNSDSVQRSDDLLAIMAVTSVTSELLQEHFAQANQHKCEMEKLHGTAEQENAAKLALREENQQLEKTKADLQKRITQISRQNRRTKNLKH